MCIKLISALGSPKNLLSENGIGIGLGVMGQDDEREERKYRIDIGAYGSIAVEAPTKKECLELFKEVTKTRRDSKIDEAIR